jgi:cell division protein FtsA
MTPYKNLTIDLGTSSIRVVLSIYRNNKREFIVKKAPSRGIKGGNIINPASAKESLSIVLNKLKLDSPTVLPNSACVIVPGNFIVNFQVESTIEFPGITTITHNEVNEVKNKAQKELFRGNLYLKNYYEIIHVIPQEFIVDKIDGIQNPIGRSGQKLTMRAIVVLGGKNHLKTVESLLKDVNLSVERFIAQPVAAFYGIRDPNFYYNNNLIVYLGAGNTEFLYFREDKPVLIKHLPTGSQDILEFLIKSLKVNRKEAERLFFEYGSAYALKFSKEELIDVNYASRTVKIPRIVIPALIQKKLQGIFKDIKSTLENEDPSYVKNLNTVFLTGGLSNLRDIEVLSQRIFKAPTVISKPDPVSDSSLSPVVGVSNYLSSLENREKLTDIKEDIRKTYGKVGWFQGIIRFLMDLI